MTVELVSKRLRLGGRTRTISAPKSDPFLARFGRGRRYADYARFCSGYLRETDRCISDLVGARHSDRLAEKPATPNLLQRFRRLTGG